MPGGGFSGKEGTVYFVKLNDESGSESISGDQAVCEVTKWTLDRTVAISKYNSNKTKGHKKAVGGVADTSGTIEIKVNPEDGQQLQPGDIVELDLVLIPEPEEGEPSIQSGEPEPSGFVIMEAVIAGSPIECDIDNGEVVGLTYPFEASDVKGYGFVESKQFGAVEEESGSV